MPFVAQSQAGLQQHAPPSSFVSVIGDLKSVAVGLILILEKRSIWVGMLQNQKFMQIHDSSWVSCINQILYAESVTGQYCRQIKSSSLWLP